MNELTERQQLILALLVELYVKEGEPVGSRTLSRAQALSLSPATIRNAMSDLEDLGLITHLHTSAGRIPTDRGYRSYVNALTEQDLTDQETAKRVMKHFSAEMNSLEDVFSIASSVLAMLSEQVAVVLYPHPEILYLRKIELVALDPYHVLVVWTSTSGVTGHRTVELSRPLEAELLIKVVRLLNDELAGKKISEASSYLLARLKDQQDALKKVYESACDIIQKSVAHIEAFYQAKLSGQDYLFEKPEFQDVQVLKRLWHALSEDTSALKTLIQHDHRAAGLHVHIGEENPVIMQDCTIVSSPYEFQGILAGTLAVIGPRRMSYRRTMGIVHYVSQAFSGALNELVGANDEVVHDD